MTIGIIGFGRFGQFLAELLHATTSHSIRVFDSKRRLASHASRIGVQFSTLKETAQADWVIVAVPIHALESVLVRIAKWVKPGTLVMDVCAVKVYACWQMEKHLPPTVDILGTHPLFGPDSGKDGLDGLQMVLCPVRVSKRRVQETANVFRAQGASIVMLTPAEHDRSITTSLALVHYLGRTLEEMGVVAPPVVNHGFQLLMDISRIVLNDTWSVFADMQRYNPNTTNMRKAFIRAARDIDQKITHGTNRERHSQNHRRD